MPVCSFSLIVVEDLGQGTNSTDSHHKPLHNKPKIPWLKLQGYSSCCYSYTRMLLIETSCFYDIKHCIFYF